MNDSHRLFRLATLGKPPMSEWRGPSLLLADLDDARPPSSTRTAAIFIAYRPDSQFTCRVMATLAQVDGVYIVDNTPRDVVSEHSFDLETAVTVIRNRRNAGLGTALNQGAAQAIADGYTHVLLMNQDDSPLEGMVSALHGGLRRWPGRGAIAAPVRIDRNVGPSEDVGQNGRMWPVIAIGTAGSLLDLQVYSEAGPFREDLFVDQVDYEYCLRVRRCGYDVVQTGDAVLENALGASSKHQLAGRCVITTNHSPVRRYYIARNRLMVARDYPDFPQYRRSQRYATMREVRNIILFEDRRLAKLKMTARGVWDYWRGRTGPLAGA